MSAHKHAKQLFTLKENVAKATKNATLCLWAMRVTEGKRPVVRLIFLAPFLIANISKKTNSTETLLQLSPGYLIRLEKMNTTANVFSGARSSSLKQKVSSDQKVFQCGSVEMNEGEKSDGTKNCRQRG